MIMAKRKVYYYEAIENITEATGSCII